MPLDILSPSEQVAVHLRELLYKGRWTGELPGTPALAKELNVDRKTIMGAIKQLEKEGLLESQGAGRARRIMPPMRRPSSLLNIRLIPYDDTNRQNPMILKLINLIEEAGHEISMTPVNMSEMNMDVTKISRMVETHPADAWMPVAASQEILQWFASQNLPTCAIFGRRRNTKLASVGPDKTHALRTAVARLVELGHRRIVLLAREERVLPSPGYLEMQFLKSLQTHGITPGDYHLPHWKNNTESFHTCLERLFQHTPPTALIADEAQFLIAAQQHLAQHHIIAPRDVSLVCCDNDILFEWFRPKIAHIHWDIQPVINQVVYWVNQLARGKNDRNPTYTQAEFIEADSIGPAQV